MEDARFTQGKGNYVDDIKLPGMLFGDFVRSPYGHARIKSINKDAALAVPGVVRVMTGQDLAEIAPETRNRLMLARERVIFAGEPVALVLAESARAAQDAADLVWVDYDVLAASVTIDEALDEMMPLVWPSRAWKSDIPG